MYTHETVKYALLAGKAADQLPSSNTRETGRSPKFPPSLPVGYPCLGIDRQLDNQVSLPSVLQDKSPRIATTVLPESAVSNDHSPVRPGVNVLDEMS